MRKQIMFLVVIVNGILYTRINTHGHSYLGLSPLPVTVANEGLQGFPTKYVIILVVTGILGGGTAQFIP